jgi:tetratricopeptide (TPR) repeat protein
MESAGHFLRGLILSAVLAAIGLWLAVRWLKRSDDPPRLVVKWILTALVLFVLVRKVVPMMTDGGSSGAIMGVPLTAVCGLILAVIWRHNLADAIAKPFASLYDGGDQEIEPHPLYSMAQAHCKRGRYLEAAVELRKQLDRFPTDLDGQLLLAELQAEHLNDLPGAMVTIQRLCLQPGHPPRNIAMALNSLADWHLKFAQDREGAREALERIVAQLPGSEFAALAAQRIAHLATTENLLAPYDRKPVVLSAGVENIGLLASDQQPKAPVVDQGLRAAEMVRHLEAHPLDTEARENLAVIYADHFDRLDLAADQLDQLIALPNQPSKRVVGWLNLLADLQIRHGADHETVRQTLARIGELFPDSVAAHAAARRLVHLKLELKGREKTGTVRLGTYEQDIGLKGGSPHQL